MNLDFWHQKWEKNEIGFHESKPNTLLVAHFNALKLIEGSRIFLPLCGKTVDIAWLLSKGYRVVGVELSRLAIEQLFLELSVAPEITKIDDIYHYSANNIDIFVGDIFEVSSELMARLTRSMTEPL